ncbi:MAG: helix-turn-helix domain-containing protein [Lachnospiraceae bacterium]|nr:helix-turn-helix domain-containing protein [Lachnospiraceae bacterium]
MEQAYYEAQWPKDGIYFNCYIHEVMNFRYHWHPDDYEMNILLQGQQYCCRGKESFLLQAGDVLVVDPNIGHASYGQTQNTIAMVLHFSSRALRQLTPKNQALSFPLCHSDETTRNQPGYRLIRCLASQLILALADGSPYANYLAKASIEMIIGTLCHQFAPEVVPSIPEVDEDTQKAMRSIMSYVEHNFAEKISLEDIAQMTQYNRTYISTLFHKSVGISFYDYLMRVRLQNALKDLVMTDKNLTEIALANGFADLKSFNNRFRDLLKCLPSEYRKNVLLTPPQSDYHSMKYIPCDDPLVAEKLQAFSEGMVM